MLHPKLLIASAALMAAAATQLFAADSAPKALAESERGSIQALVQQMQESYRSAVSAAAAEAQAPEKPRRVDAIADARMAQERAKVLRFLNLDPDSEHALYIFVSWSMPLPMLRAYAIEAMWTGGTLVFRGLPPGRSMQDFFIQDLSQLVWDKGASAAISVDPRLFDAYEVQAVPSIVLSATRENLSCAGAGEKSLSAQGRAFRYSRCPPVAQDRYVKLSGTITLDYALEAFQRDGRKEAALYLASLRRGYPAGRKASQRQLPFQGEWADAFTPSQLMEQSLRRDSKH